MKRRNVLPPLVAMCMLEIDEAGIPEVGNKLQIEEIAFGVSFCCRHNLGGLRTRIREAWRALKGYHEVDIVVTYYDSWRIHKYLNRLFQERGGI